MERERIREVLLQVWGEQACRRPSDWPPVLARMMAPGTLTRGSMRPVVERAVAEIGAKLDEGVIVGNDIWRIFGKLDQEHRDQLAARLNAEAWR